MRGTETDDYKKLVRVMKYIQVTIGLPLILSINNSLNIKWYVDAVFAVQNGTRSHNSGFMAMVTEGTYLQYIKQKLKNKISTDANLVGVEDVLTQVIWTRYFLKEQGHI